MIGWDRSDYLEAGGFGFSKSVGLQTSRHERGRTGLREESCRQPVKASGSNSLLTTNKGKQRLPVKTRARCRSLKAPLAAAGNGGPPVEGRRRCLVLLWEDVLIGAQDEEENRIIELAVEEKTLLVVDGRRRRPGRRSLADGRQRRPAARRHPRASRGVFFRVTNVAKNDIETKVGLRLIYYSIINWRILQNNTHRFYTETTARF